MARTNHGFTIIELMFSTVIFSVVLLLCLSALIQIGRMYYKGVTTSQTQNAARAVMDELEQAIQFSPRGIRAPGPLGPDIPDASASTDYICIGQLKYNFAVDRQQKLSSTAPKQIKHALWVSEDPDCLSGPAAVDLNNPPTPGRDLLGENMRLTRLRLIPVGSGDSTWQIDVSVAYGEEDLLKATALSKQCDGPQIGTQFCAVSDLSTVVKRRVE